MNCPSTSSLEDLVAGRLNPDQEKKLLGHVSRCSACSKEVAFLKAALSATKTFSDQKGCISDEMLCAFVDGALDESQSEQVLEHLSRCDDCSAALANLVRSLDDTFSEHLQPMSPPMAVLNRAIRIGAPGRSASAGGENKRKGLFSLFTPGSLPYRMGFAGFVASAVLILVVLVSRPSNEPPLPGLPDAGLKAGRSGQLVASTKPVIPKHVQKQEQSVEKSGNVASGLEKPSGKTKPVSNGALASLSSKRRARLGAVLLPKVVFSSLESKAFTAKKNAVASAYRIGRTIGFLEEFGDYAMESEGLRGSASSALSSLEIYIQSSSIEKPDRHRLVKYISELNNNLEPGTLESGKASLRIRVLCSAVRNIMENRPETGPGLRLGLLVQGWSMDVLVGGKTGFDKLKTARRIIRSSLQLSEHARKVALNNIDKLEKSADFIDPENRTRQLIERLKNFERTIVSETPAQ